MLDPVGPCKPEYKALIFECDGKLFILYLSIRNLNKNQSQDENNANKSSAK